WTLIALIGFLGSTVLLLPAGRAEVIKIKPDTERGNASSQYKLSDASDTHISPLIASPMPVAPPVFEENFDGVTAPALPAGWTTDTRGPGTAWTTSPPNPATAPNAAFGPETIAGGVTNLYSPTIAVPAGGPAQLQFRNLYNLEFDTAAGPATGFDGMVLELSINGGGCSGDLSAGGEFFTRGYNRPSSPG